MSNEADQWKRVAIYLADCHAANLHIAELKKTSRAEKERLKLIMETAATMLKGDVSSVRTYTEPDKDLRDVIERLEDHAKRIK